MKKNKILILAITTLLSTIAFSVTFFTTASAYTGLNNNITDEELYNATNTYNVSSENFNNQNEFIIDLDENRITNKNQYNITYNMQSKNSNLVMSDAQITVLTHGYGAYSSDWSNQYSKDNLNVAFAYDPNSMISKINNEVGGANIYWAEIESDFNKLNRYNQFNLYDITNQKSTDSIYIRTNVIEQITDISKHIIIVFDAQNSYNSHNNVYYQFNHMLSSVIYDFKQLSGGVLPKVNLIGHSRGGITNMQYALDHPDLVESMVSLGTPYFGSTTVNLFGEEFLEGTSDGLDDILDPDKYESLCERWNINYDELYSNIDVLAHGSCHSYDGIIRALLSDKSGTITDDIKEKINFIKALNFPYEFLPTIDLQTEYSGARAISIILNGIFKGHYTAAKISDLASIIASEIDYNLSIDNVYWYNDVLVHLSSQLGIGDFVFNKNKQKYKGFNRKTRCFDGESENFLRVSQYNVPVGHNLIARDEIVIKNVVEYLKFSTHKTNNFEYYDNEDGTILITDYFGEDVNDFIVPAYIDGKAVSNIASYAFSNKDFTTVTIPASVKTIGESAFENCENLTTVTFANNSLLTDIKSFAFKNNAQLSSINLPNTVKTINDEVFSGCNSLESINLGNTLETIGYKSFYNCSSLTNISLPNTLLNIGFGAFGYCTAISGLINLPANIDLIDPYAFIGCSNISEFSVADTNELYYTIDGVLYKKEYDEYLGNMLITYPEGKTDSTFIVADDVKYIKSYAIVNNSYLQTLDLNDATRLDIGALYNVSNLTSVNGGNVEYADITSFYGVPWANDESVEFLSIGHVLLKYNGNDERLYIDNYKRIGALAFCENSTLTNISFGEDIEEIGDFTFYNCTDLIKVDFAIQNIRVKIGKEVFANTNEDIQFYVFEPLLTDYKASEGWQKLDEKINCFSTTIKFNTLGGDDLQDQTVIYGGYLDLPSPLRKGYNFWGWYDNENFEGEQLTENAMWRKFASEYTIYAKWQAMSSFITVESEHDLDLSGFNQIVSYNENYELGIPTRENYNFDGWECDGDLITDETGKCINKWQITSQNVLVKPVWSPIPTKVKFDVNLEDLLKPFDTTIVFGEIKDTKGNDLPVLYDNTQEFLGWYTIVDNKEIEYTNNQGVLKNNWDLFGNVTLTAKWVLKEFDIMYHLDGGVEIDNPQQYNFETETIILKNPTKPGYEFNGWYLHPNFEGEDIDRIEKGSYGDKSFYAKWSILTYHINYNFNDGKYIYNENIFTVETEYTFNSPTKQHYNFLGWYDDDDILWSKIKIGTTGNLNLTAKWELKTYNIIYSNPILDSLVNLQMKANALIYITEDESANYQTYNYDVPIKFSYGQTIDLKDIKAFYYFNSYTDGYRNYNYVFEGWYKDENRTIRITSITCNEERDYTVYGKWSYQISQATLDRTYTINDSGRFKQKYDILDIGLNSNNEFDSVLYNNLIKLGIKSITIDIKINMWEINDGYQYLFIYNGLSEDLESLWGQTIEHGGSGCDKNAYIHEFQAKISIEKLDNCKNLVLRYGASGSWEDDWKNNEVVIDIEYTTDVVLS